MSDRARRVDRRGQIGSTVAKRREDAAKDERRAEAPGASAHPRAEPTPPVAVILAAGEGRRMGTPKARLRWRGRTFVEHVVALAQGAGCDDVIVVWGAVPLDDVAASVSARAGCAVDWVCNEDYARGVSTSLRLGLRHALECADRRRSPDARAVGVTSVGADPSTASPSQPGVLVMTVDRPHLRQETLAALVQAAQAHPAAIVQPTRDGRRGHPIVWPFDLARVLSALPDDATPRELLAQPAIAARRLGVASDDPAIFDDLDTPDDLARLP
jgi:CTP:molybdopterin cytidylyltransferase MocA